MSSARENHLCSFNLDALLEFHYIAGQTVKDGHLHLNDLGEKTFNFATGMIILELYDISLSELKRFPFCPNLLKIYRQRY